MVWAARRLSVSRPSAPRPAAPRLPPPPLSAADDAGKAEQRSGAGRRHPLRREVGRVERSLARVAEARQPVEVGAARVRAVACRGAGRRVEPRAELLAERDARPIDAHCAAVVERRVALDDGRVELDGESPQASGVVGGQLHDRASGVRIERAEDAVGGLHARGLRAVHVAQDAVLAVVAVDRELRRDGRVRGEAVRVEIQDREFAGVALGVRSRRQDEPVAVHAAASGEIEQKPPAVGVVLGADRLVPRARRARVVVAPVACVGDLGCERRGCCGGDDRDGIRLDAVHFSSPWRLLSFRSRHAHQPGDRSLAVR